MNAFFRLTQRELLRFVRRPSQIGATLATPASIWVFLASGLGNASAGYAGDLAPAMAILVVLFATIFAGMSLIEDRHAGLLRGVLVSPAPRWAIAAGKLVPSSLIAVVQALPILLASLLLDAPPSVIGIALGLGVLFLTAVAVGGLGLASAWWIDSSRGYHGLITAAIMPLWLLSGAVFPEGASAGWIEAIEAINPVAWCAGTLHAALDLAPTEAPLALLGTILFALAGLAAATMSVGRSAR